MLRDLVDIFFPEVCAGCDSLLKSGEFAICTFCRHDLPLTNHHLHRENEVFRRFYGRLPLEWASALCYYHKKGIVQEMIHKLKYRGVENVGTVLGRWYATDLRKIDGLSDVKAVIPVPLHPKKQRQRGYNQVTEFGKSIASGLGIPYNDQILIRQRYSKTQTKKNLIARTSLQKNLFDVINVDEISGGHYLLVDDVITTGSTLEACGKAILKISGARISIVCIAMSHW
jgi:ComF family protein